MGLLGTIFSVLLTILGISALGLVMFLMGALVYVVVREIKADTEFLR